MQSDLCVPKYIKLVTHKFNNFKKNVFIFSNDFLHTFWNKKHLDKSVTKISCYKVHISRTHPMGMLLL